MVEWSTPTWWSYVTVETDPTDSHVYYRDEKYMGQTKDNTSVGIDLTNKIFTSTVKQKHNLLVRNITPTKVYSFWDNDTIIIRKRGYEEKKYTFPVEYFRGEEGKIYAKNNPQKIMVVLTTPALD